MSQKLVDRSPDLKRLRNDGYDIHVIGTHLLVRNIPYVNNMKEVKRGTLVSTLTLQQDKTIKPADHVATFNGERPCDRDGNPLTNIIIEDKHKGLAPGVEINFTFSSKPTHGQGYPDYFEKMVTYIKILSNEAKAIDQTITAITNPIIESDEVNPVFKYFDTSSSRAGIDALSPKLALGKVAILGLGGTGSYILDLVAKTHVVEIHLFDDDKFLQHNAFRCPGAVAIEDLQPDLLKVEYYKALYSKLRNGIVAHPYRVDSYNANELRDMNFVFVCLDSGEHKDVIMKVLEETGIAFIDVGMGVHETDASLHGILRVTTSTPQKREHVRGNQRISFAPATGNNEYSRNIQVADLNCLNAALAVIRWKKLCGFYNDLEHEHHSTYVINTSKLSREDQ